MNDASKKSFEMQAQIRQNVNVFQNTIGDLYNWEKEIKEREKALAKQLVATQEIQNAPVRSAIAELKRVRKSNNQQQPQRGQEQNYELNLSDTSSSSSSSNSSSNSLPSSPEKKEEPLQSNEEKRKLANQCKERGNKCVQLREYEKGIQEYTKAIDIYPEDPIFFCNRALCYLKLERYNLAIADCDAAIALNKSHVKAYYRRMQAHEYLGNDLAALNDCTIALSIEPNSSETKASWERINARLKKSLKSHQAPIFMAATEGYREFQPIDKKPHERSQKPLRTVPVRDVFNPQELKISDDDIDKIFNSSCGSFVEVKKTATSEKPKEKPKITELETKQKPKEAIIEEINKNLKDSNDNLVATARKATTEHIVASDKKMPNKADVTIDSNKYSEKPTALGINKITEPQEERPMPPAPTSTRQFYANWKELSISQKYQYLQSINPKIFCKVLGAGFDSDTLTDILHILHAQNTPDQVQEIAKLLLEVSKNNQIPILSMLMSTEENKMLTEIFNSIKESKKVDVTTIDAIAKNFNLKC